MAECHILFLGHCNLDRNLVFRIIVSGAYLFVSFEIGIPNLVCGCILVCMLGCCVLFNSHYCLKLDEVLRIIVSGANLLYYLRPESRICCVNASWDVGVSHSIFGHCDPDL